MLRGFGAQCTSMSHKSSPMPWFVTLQFRKSEVLKSRCHQCWSPPEAPGDNWRPGLFQLLEWPAFLGSRPLLHPRGQLCCILRSLLSDLCHRVTISHLALPASFKSSYNDTGRLGQSTRSLPQLPNATVAAGRQPRSICKHTGRWCSNKTLFIKVRRRAKCGLSLPASACPGLQSLTTPPPYEAQTALPPPCDYRASRARRRILPYSAPSAQVLGQRRNWGGAFRHHHQVVGSH